MASSADKGYMNTYIYICKDRYIYIHVYADAAGAGRQVREAKKRFDRNARMSAEVSFPHAVTNFLPLHSRMQEPLS